MLEGGWTAIEDGLPEKDVWVQVYEDDTIDPQQVFISTIVGSEIRSRVTPAKLLWIDPEGWPDWYLCYIGGGPVRHVRNVTHWRHMSSKPLSKNVSFSVGCDIISLSKKEIPHEREEAEQANLQIPCP